MIICPVCHSANVRDYVTGIHTHHCLDCLARWFEPARKAPMIITAGNNAEPQCNCGGYRRGQLTGGWICPIHGQQF